MPRFDISANGLVETRAGRIAAFLQAQGVTVTGVSVEVNPETGVPIFYHVDASTNPTTALASYVLTPDALEVVRKPRVDLLRSYVQLVEGGGTPTAAQTARALAALTRVLVEALPDL
jgi:hypothetical protein